MIMIVEGIAIFLLFRRVAYDMSSVAPLTLNDNLLEHDIMGGTIENAVIRS